MSEQFPDNTLKKFESHKTKLDEKTANINQPEEKFAFIETQVLSQLKNHNQLSHIEKSIIKKVLKDVESSGFIKDIRNTDQLEIIVKNAVNIINRLPEPGKDIDMRLINRQSENLDGFKERRKSMAKETALQHLLDMENALKHIDNDILNGAKESVLGEIEDLRHELDIDKAA